MADPRINSTFRVAVNIAMVSLIVLLIAQTAGLFPNMRQASDAAHWTICRSLALNCSVLASHDKSEAISRNLTAATRSHAELVAATLYGSRGEVLASAEASSGPRAETSRRRAFFRAPVGKNGRDWGRLELEFAPNSRVPLFGWSVQPWVRMVVLVTLTNILLFMLYVQRLLKQFAHSHMPRRVRSALDSLSQGLVILDERQRIILANEAFLNVTRRRSRDVIGRSLAEFPWDAASASFWSGEAVDSDAPLTLQTAAGPRKLMVETTRIVNEGGAGQGVLVTFSDVTTLERNRETLLLANRTLEASRNRIKRQNEQLQILANRDPLTNCWNRRAFLEELQRHWTRVQRSQEPLSAVMLDIDHFKSVNDNHGHSVGDRVLQEVAAAIHETVRPGDCVCRYGGEEFCVLLPDVELEDAVETGWRFRETIKRLKFKGLRVTASVGVSSAELGARTSEDMLEQADQALLAAKRGGRDRVFSWDMLVDGREPSVTPGKETRRFHGTLVADHSTVPFQVVTSLLSALAFRDAETVSHCMRVADFSFLLGQSLLSASDLYALEVAALLHDIGKIGVPDSILLKPEQLTDEEWKVMNRHLRIGFEIVESAFDCKPLEAILRCHHLPYRCQEEIGQLSGKDLPIGARIVSIADAYDSMVSGSVYRAGRDPELAFAELRRCAGTQFDPDLVAQFIDVVRRQPTPAKAQQATSSKQLALLLGQSTDRIARAFDDRDLETLRAQAQRLIETARRYHSQQVEAIAQRLLDAAGDSQLPRLLDEVLELLEACRASQRACLYQASEATYRIAADLDLSED